MESTTNGPLLLPVCERLEPWHVPRMTYFESRLAGVFEEAEVDASGGDEAGCVIWRRAFSQPPVRNLLPPVRLLISLTVWEERLC